MNGNGHHWSKFCWRDWQSDEALRMCSMAAQGFWMRLLCIAHGADPVGHVLVNGRQPTTRQLAAITGATEKEVTAYSHELEEAGVFSRTDNGTIYSRRMVRDTAMSEQGREHIKKRWTKPEPNSPPNRGNGEHPNSPPNSEASSHPITKSQNLESEVEQEEGEKYSDFTPLSGGTESRARDNGRVPDEPLPEKFAVHVRRAAQACRMSIPYGAVRSRSDQLDAVTAAAASDAHPGVALEGEVIPPGVRYQPQDPVRTVEEQLAILRSAA